ncbi:hypothetical protein [[Enterobacter] lignolyticus]|uniref:hypothetical protein n=1 Tax=[Enterobacter] lignolyticus TaxID=1334193 RepID=UPI001EF0C759|nr:hypothetical protein [[Enterobacter] lignolyticus]
MEHRTIIYIIIVLYMLAMIGIGLYAKTKIKNAEDYHLAGRRLGPVMLAGTLAATEIGGGSSVGVAAKAYGAWGYPPAGMWSRQVWVFSWYRLLHPICAAQWRQPFRKLLAGDMVEVVTSSQPVSLY